MMDDLSRFQAYCEAIWYIFDYCIRTTGIKEPLQARHPSGDSHGVGFVSAAFPADLPLPLSTAGDVATLFFGILYPGRFPPFFDFKSELLAYLRFVPLCSFVGLLPSSCCPTSWSSPSSPGS